MKRLVHFQSFAFDHLWLDEDGWAHAGLLVGLQRLLVLALQLLVLATLHLSIFVAASARLSQHVQEEARRLDGRNHGLLVQSGVLLRQLKVIHARTRIIVIAMTIERPEVTLMHH